MPVFVRAQYQCLTSPRWHPGIVPMLWYLPKMEGVVGYGCLPKLASEALTHSVVHVHVNEVVHACRDVHGCLIHRPDMGCNSASFLIRQLSK